MKYSLFFLIFLLVSCSQNLNTLNKKKIYTAKGFAYVYNDYDSGKKIIKGKMNNDKMQISHQNLRVGTLLRVTNLKNKKNIVLKNERRIKYPDFYKILITDAVSQELNLSADLPLVEIVEIKKNKSFVAKKAKIYSEEKKLPSKAPVASVQISNISKNKEINLKKSKDKIYILIGSFYSTNTAKFLKDRILKEQPNLSHKKLIIKKINNKETQVLSGPYNSVNLLKNDYIKLKSLGFEELDIFLNE